MQNDRILIRVNTLNLNLHESQMNLSILTFLKETSMKKIFASILIFACLTALVTEVSACPKGKYKDSHGACR